MRSSSRSTTKTMSEVSWSSDNRCRSTSNCGTPASDFSDICIEPSLSVMICSVDAGPDRSIVVILAQFLHLFFLDIKFVLLLLISSPKTKTQFTQNTGFLPFISTIFIQSITVNGRIQIILLIFFFWWWWFKAKRICFNFLFHETINVFVCFTFRSLENTIKTLDSINMCLALEKIHKQNHFNEFYLE